MLTFLVENRCVVFQFLTILKTQNNIFRGFLKILGKRSIVKHQHTARLYQSLNKEIRNFGRITIYLTMVKDLHTLK